MDNQHTEVTKTSYGGSIKNALVGVLIGIILFVVSFILLWWNEGNSIRLIQKEDFIHKNAIFVNSDTVNRSNDSKLIATNGNVYTDETLTDTIISVEKALVLERKVEMYQWIEEKHTSERKHAGGSTTKTTTYTYEKKWDDVEHDSNKFKKAGHRNPKFPLKSKDITANSATMGDFKISQKQVASIRSYNDINNLTPVNGFDIFDNYYYKGNNFTSPNVGDIRISYRYVPSGASISVIGQQNWDNSIGNMPTKSGDIYLQYDGIYGLDEMLEKYKKSNMFLSYGLRLGGFLIMFIGLKLLTGPIVAIAEFIPPLASLVETLSSLVLFAIALVLSLSTIAIAWFAHRPLLTLLLLAIIGTIIYCLKQNAQNKKDFNLAQHKPF